MLGDGKTEYDQGNDGEANAIGACSVSFTPDAGMAELMLRFS